MVKKRKGWKDAKKYIDAILDRNSVRQWILAVLVCAGLFAILAINFLPSEVDLEVGQVSPRDIVSPKTIVNRPETERLQRERAEKAEVEALEDLDNYDLNYATIIRAEERIDGTFTTLRQGFFSEETTEENQEAQQPLSVEEIQFGLHKNWGIELSSDAIRLVLAHSLEDFQSFAAQTRQILLELMNQKIPERDLQVVRNKVPELIGETQIPSRLQQVTYSLGQQIIQPNLTVNVQKIEQIKQDASEQVEPVYVQANEIIVRNGEVVSEEHIIILQDLGLYRSPTDYLSYLGLLAIVLLLLASLGIYLYQNKPEIIENEAQLALLGVIILVVSFIAKILATIHWEDASLLTPVALASILITVLLDSRLAIVATLVLGVVVGIVTGFNSTFIILALAGGLSGVFGISKVGQRGDLMRAGFIVGAVNFIVIVILSFIQKDTSLLIHSYLGVLNGIISSIIAIGFLPYLESVFGITSAIKLLELSNPNHPLLKRLMMEAPGTYHHSIIVGNMAEAAADAIGADGLLARVGSNFHDIGKIKRPYFFVENQVGMENPHNKVSPSLSTLIITAHVKDGLELAKQYNLPDEITNFIAEHHGTDLVKYFYHRAVETSNENEHIEEEDYRYSGPRPQSKETAIVSLADAVEAAVRALPKPTPGKIEGLVRKIIKERLNSGQLDECELTFRDLDKIADAFVHVLAGIFHPRIEYPENITREEIEGKKSKSGNPHQQPAE